MKKVSPKTEQRPSCIFNLTNIAWILVPYCSGKLPTFFCIFPFNFLFEKGHPILRNRCKNTVLINANFLCIIMIILSITLICLLSVCTSLNAKKYYIGIWFKIENKCLKKFNCIFMELYHRIYFLSKRFQVLLKSCKWQPIIWGNRELDAFTDFSVLCVFSFFFTLPNKTLTKEFKYLYK